nr:hypothetical protein BaRGS_022789 [Batillaria attramentaria]
MKFSSARPSKANSKKCWRRTRAAPGRQRSPPSARWYRVNRKSARMYDACVSSHQVAIEKRRHLEEEWAKAAEEKLVQDHEDKPWLLEHRRRVLGYGKLK